MTIGGVFAHEHLNSIWFRCLQGLDTIDTSSCKLTYSNKANLRNLLHLVRRIVPNSGTKTPTKLQGVPYSHCVLQVGLAIDYTISQAMDVSKQDSLVYVELPSEFSVLLVRRKVHATEFGLQDETSLVRGLCKVHFDVEFNAISLIKLLVQFFFGRSKSYFLEFVGLD